MIKRIRDFIYDINDVFVAIVILLIAVGVIFWRSTSIMAYPQYLAEKNGNTEVPVPKDQTYTVSGDNCGGFIVSALMN